MSIANKIAWAVHQSELRHSTMLGARPMEARASAWNTYYDVIDIANAPAPTHYQTTEATIITGKGR